MDMMPRSDGTFHIERSTDPADVTVIADGTVLNDVIWGDLHLDKAIDDDLIRIDGDPSTGRRFLDLFPLPEPATIAN